ncbi:hypothetical protein FSP39_023154 [Pinctada imbricata]|uniref:Uncharacterized protein n=1 Tax=Pinctada imbricata TaxID=66713 RepID=A0AA89BP69_PINIB|nr:hypothetical protein FSP39_023154 [Pinctada imbricata]
MTDSEKSFAVSWRTDSTSQSYVLSNSSSKKPGHATKLRRSMNVESARNSGMKFPSWREPKPLRTISRPLTAQGSNNTPPNPKPPRKSLTRATSIACDPRRETTAQRTVNRLMEPTLAARMKTVEFNKRTTHADNNHYSWSNMAVYRDHQKTLYTPGGGMKRSFRSGSRR